MIKTHRNFLLQGNNQHHAHIHINPIGELDIDIIESEQHHSAEFDDLTFKCSGAMTTLVGVDPKVNKQWHLSLDNRDAEELNVLITQATEEFEVLMKDL
ncbi:hypothetical protein [Photobacterium minamisatsumaniensis]|uniref:hypothetical protein n=1 Tax=Photobacterium minamisatsumaniensis TaxID=2910233 RepID=UPI003D11EE2C